MAFATRYAVRTHVVSSTLDERLPAMLGNATLATLVSRTSMKVASIAVAAMIQGLITVVFMALPCLTGENRRIHVHARPENESCRHVFEDDLYGNPLDNLDEVARRIFRGQKAELRSSRTGNGIDVSFKGAAVHVHLHFSFLARSDICKLCLFEICRDPHIGQGNYR